MRELRQYIRDFDGNPYGIMVAEITDTEYRIGYSVCNLEDTYNKELGLKIAIGRMQSKRKRRIPVRTDIKVQYDTFVYVCERALAKKD